MLNKKSRLPWRLALARVICLFAISTAALAQQEDGGAAELVVEDREGHKQSALLLDTAITGRIDGLVASLTLRQRFRNPATEWVNGEYLFPLPDHAAVDSLTLETDGKRIRGVVKEKKQAKREFETAKKAGKKAGLVEQRRPNLFAMALANIPPGGEVLAEVTWVESVAFTGGRFSLALPTTLTPRYIPGQAIAITGEVRDFEASATISPETGSGWALNTDQVPDASLITPPQVAGKDIVDSHRFTAELELRPGIAITGVNSVTHALKVSEPDDQAAAWRISLADQSALMDSDLLLEWAPAASTMPEAAVFSQRLETAEKKSESSYNLLMIMPPVQNVVQTLPRELIFIIDSSGSMAGVSMPQAKQGLKTALGYLTAQDRFNVIDFDSSARALFGQPASADADALRRANAFVDRLDADGGTNMEAALNLAFSQETAEGHLRQIVFITDGSVGNEAGLFSLIHRRLGDARLFTMGIGAAPNSHFMRGAARYGRGSFHFTRQLDQAGQRMGELFSRINRPVMRDITVRWPDGAAVDMVPARAPDLYLGEPLILSSRSDKPVGQVVISGKLAGQFWQRTVKLGNAGSAENLDKIWARGKVEQLESDQVMTGQPMEDARDAIVNIGVTHQLATRYTSFVAVEEKVSRPVAQSPRKQVVPNLMPKGNTMPVPMPNTATSGTLLSLLGSIMILVAGLLKMSRRRRRDPALEARR